MKAIYEKILIGLPDGIVIPSAFAAFVAATGVEDYIPLIILFLLTIAGTFLMGISGYFNSSIVNFWNPSARANAEKQEQIEAEKLKTITHFRSMELPEEMLRQAIQEIDEEHERWMNLGKSFPTESVQLRGLSKIQNAFFIALGYAIGGAFVIISFIQIQPSLLAFVCGSFAGLIFLLLFGILFDKNFRAQILSIVFSNFLGLAVILVAYLVGSFF